MEVSGINNQRAMATGNGLADANLGGMEFLNLLVEQLKNQDPLNPQDSTEFASQLAQFTSLEQMVQMNGSLRDVSLYQASLNNLSSIGMIGREITVADADLVLLAEGQAGAINYTLDEDMQNVQVEISDESGTVVFTSDEEPQAMGDRVFEWDGRGDDGLLLPDGQYTYEIVATNYDDERIPVRTEGTYIVDGVRFIGGVTYLDVDGTLLSMSDVIAVRSREEG